MSTEPFETLLEQDQYWMRHALALAKKAAALDEVPVGAVIVKDNQLVAEGWNQPVSSCDPTAHAEVVAIRAAAHSLCNYRLIGCTLYVTIEPCTMCVGSLLHSRLARVVYGAKEPKAGAIDSRLKLLHLPHFNHRIESVGEVLASECSGLISAFFSSKRALKKKLKKAE